jgi:hypothetical protein
MIWHAADDLVTGQNLHPPLIGRPAFVDPAVTVRLGAALQGFFVAGGPIAAPGRDTELLGTILKERYALRKVVPAGQAEVLVPLTAVQPPGHSAYDLVAGAGTLEDRALYDLVVIVGNRRQPLSYHCVYAKHDWSGFGFAHATDWHASQRLEGFRPALRRIAAQAGTAQAAEAVAGYNNFNDRVREFIGWANTAHDAGTLDLIVATGDLVDYQFEEAHNPRGGGNFQFLIDLLRGGVPPSDPSTPKSEELRVPIIASLGNHDYRPNPYELCIDVDVPASKDPRIASYGPHNLTETDARALQNGIPTLSRSDAARAVAIATPNWYLRWFADARDYVVAVGPHRFVMLDTGPDTGVVDTLWEGFEVWAGFGSETESNFAAGSPSTTGFTDQQLQIVRSTLDAGPGGLVVVGVHAPPLNMLANRYAHYFRETEHMLQGGRVFGYLAANTPAIAPPTEGQVRATHPDWFTDGAWFKSGTVEDMLDFGTADSAADAFLSACAGVGRRRPADLVLMGHAHRNVEYRLTVDGAGGLRYALDFYTENPTEYYASPDPVVRADGRMTLSPVYHHVRAGANPAASPTTIQDGHTPYQVLDLPPYAAPLTAAADKRGWWGSHRPLVVQTASLGPVDKPQRSDAVPPPKPEPAFQGWRVFTVEGNVIQSCRAVRSRLILPHIDAQSEGPAPHPAIP